MALCVNKEWLADTETHHARFVFDPKTTHERPKRIEKAAQFIVLSCLGACEKSLLQFESSCDRVAFCKSILTHHALTRKTTPARTLASTPKWRHHAHKEVGANILKLQKMNELTKLP